MIWKDEKIGTPQPTYADLWDAFVCGAREARMNPTADEKAFNRAADGYCKLIHSQKDPEMFAALSGGGEVGPAEKDVVAITSTASGFLAKLLDECPETKEPQKLAYVGGSEKGHDGALVVITRGDTTAWKHAIHSEEMEIGNIPVQT